MRKYLPLLLIGFLAISIVDILGSIASRTFNFSYSYFIPLSLIIYTIIPFFISKTGNKTTAIICGAALAFFDATAGWQFSIYFKANTGAPGLQINLVAWVMSILFMTFIGGLFGYFGAWLEVKLSKKKS